MDELTRILWEYACKYRLESCYDRYMQEERKENEEVLQKNQEKLKNLCSVELWTKIDNLSDALETIRLIDEEAAFLCGLRLGLSLR